MTFSAVLYDSEVRCWLRFNELVEIVEIHDPSMVLSALEYLENQVENKAFYAAGCVSYEAASAFDSALTTQAKSDFPLLLFGLFASVDTITLPISSSTLDHISWHASEDRQLFISKVESIQAAIARGDTYQVNLTFPLHGDFSGDPWPLFLHLVRGEPPDSAGFLQTDRWGICSFSPELFFSRQGNRLTMRPMKGTAPRGRNQQDDLRQAKTLQSSAKNRAENIMILDMVRNDLGRLAPPGGVCTTSICSLEKYPTLWQLTSAARAVTSAPLVEIFQALFPCASVTGAPKAKTMEIISQTESTPRSLYTGTFGWIKPGRQSRFNVAIRTILIDRQAARAVYGVGAGITWDSDGNEEYQECMDKASILTRVKRNFSLIETLRWTPGKGYFILHEHLARLQHSADYFDFPCPLQQIQSFLTTTAMTFQHTPQRVRLLLHPDGQFEVSHTMLDPEPSSPLKLCFAESPVNSQDVYLYHKTTNREIYERCLSEGHQVDEVVLWNERNEVTECCTANLVVEKGGDLITPASDCGLLPGTYREFLLRRGVLKEALISKAELEHSARIFLINAVRKWRRAILLPGQEKE